MGVTAAGSSVVVSVADWVVSQTLVAVTSTVCGAEIPAGAVYRPLGVIAPRPAGLMLQVTAVLAVLVTLAVNCCVWPPVRVTLNGATVTDTGGISVTIAVDGVDATPSVVPVIVTVCCDWIVAGAVYNPVVESVPGEPVGIDHTAVAAALQVAA